MRSQVSGIDQSRFPGRTVWEIRKAGNIAKKRALRLSLTALFTSADHLQALGWCLMRPKEMEDLATFSVRELKKTAAEERDEYSSAEGQ